MSLLGGRTPPYLCSRPCLPSFREIVRAVLEKNAEMTNIEGKRQGRSNLGCLMIRKVANGLIAFKLKNVKEILSQFLINL